MKNNIQISRVIVNILFYIFYVLLASIIFSFAFPFVLITFWRPILNPADPIFVKIQVVIIVLVLILTLLFRRYFYLPIRSKENTHINKEELEFEYSMKMIEEQKEKNSKIENIANNSEIFQKQDMMSVVSLEWQTNKIDEDELDIKIGREIK